MGYVLGDFFSNTSGHPDTLPMYVKIRRFRNLLNGLSESKSNVIKVLPHFNLLQNGP
jgi:hypothetical protein